MTATTRTRPIGVTASIESGGATIRAASGAVATLAQSASMEGFNPLELLDASLAACLVISAKMAARPLGFSDRITDLRVEVVHAKAADLPSRVASLTCRFFIGGDLTDAEKALLQAEAHKLCTVGHTLEHRPAIEDGEPLEG